MEKVILGIFLSICAYWDYRSREIPVWFLAAGILTGIAGNVIYFGVQSEGWRRLGSGSIIGVFFCVLSWFLPEQVGMADGLIVLGAGIMAGWRITLFSVQWGLVFMFPAAFFWGVLKKKKNRTLPFAPFFLGGYLWQILWGSC